jgi:hypothetical protein
VKNNAMILLWQEPGEGHKRGWPPLIRMDEATRKKIDALLGGKP